MTYSFWVFNIYIYKYLCGGSPDPRGWHIAWRWGDVSHNIACGWRNAHRISHAGDATHTEYRMRVTQRTQNIAVRVTERTLNHRISQCGWRNAGAITSPAQCVGVTPEGDATHRALFFYISYYIFFFWNFKNLWIFLMLRNIIEYIRGKL